MNKNYESNLRLDQSFKWENHQPTFNDFVCDENHFKK
jgi:hypothetical protein